MAVGAGRQSWGSSKAEREADQHHQGFGFCQSPSSTELDSTAAKTVDKVPGQHGHREKKWLGPSPGGEQCVGGAGAWLSREEVLMPEKASWKVRFLLPETRTRIERRRNGYGHA